MASPAVKKRKVSSLSGGQGNEIDAQHTVESLSEQDSSDKRAITVRGNAPYRSGHTTIRAKRNAAKSWSSGTYDSSMFKLKVDQLLTNVRPDYERRMVKLENSLRRLKHIIERIPDREAKPVCSVAFVCFVKRLTFA